MRAMPIAPSTKINGTALPTAAAVPWPLPDMAKLGATMPRERPMAPHILRFLRGRVYGTASLVSVLILPLNYVLVPERLVDQQFSLCYDFSTSLTPYIDLIGRNHATFSCRFAR